MPVLLVGEVEGVTQEMHDGMLAALGGPLRQAKGFIAHFAGPHQGRWIVMELWESKADATAWFADFVHPNLPPGIKPKRTFHDVGSLVVR